VKPAVAAGHAATAEAGAEILQEGGSAADAAVAACLASCVAETLMTGLLGGGHAAYLEAATGTVRNLDCFVAVPSGVGAPMDHLQVPFGEELVDYAVGASSCGVPGLPDGLDVLWRAQGRLPWARLVEPALALARGGVAMSAAHAACLRMLAPVMTLREGARIYRPGDALLGEGDLLEQPGLVSTLELIRDEGARSVYEGTIAATLLELIDERAGAIRESDLRRYQAEWRGPERTSFCGRRVVTRAGLSHVPETLARYDPTGWPGSLLAALRPLAGNGHTTNLTIIDADGNACVLTTSLGLGSGDWLPGLDLHLNSMLGEVDLIREPLEPGARMPSMMAPTFVFDGEGLELAIGAAGGTRLRTALVGVLGAILGEGLEPQAAVDRPRFHPAGEVVNVEPGVDEGWLATLEGDGWAVRRWLDRHHYFGGVSAVGRSGAAADPRRSGAVRFPTP
jgi:gamma-glutamyltranspeptidase/glutathione hydrolase